VKSLVYDPRESAGYDFIVDKEYPWHSGFPGRDPGHSMELVDERSLGKSQRLAKCHIARKPVPGRFGDCALDQYGYGRRLGDRANPSRTRLGVENFDENQ
jgi:hypothetical protein